MNEQNLESTPKRWHSWLRVVFVLYCVATLVLAVYGVNFKLKQYQQSSKLSDNFSQTADGPAIYYHKSDAADVNKVVTKFYRVSTKANQPDELITQVTLAPNIVPVSGLAQTVLFQNKLLVGNRFEFQFHTLDLSQKNTELKMVYKKQVEEGQNFGDLKSRLIDNGQTLVYVDYTTSDGRTRWAVPPTIRLVNLSDQTETASTLPELAENYFSYNLLTVSSDNQTLYFEATGGEDNDVKQKPWVKYDRQTNTFTKLESLPVLVNKDYPEWPVINNANGLTIFKVSPDGTKVAYIDFSQPVDIKDLDMSDGSANTRYNIQYCLKTTDANIKKYGQAGAVIKLLDLQTNEIKEIYREQAYNLDQNMTASMYLEYPYNDLCVNLANRISGLAWIDDNTLAFTNFNGLRSLDVANSTAQIIYNFPESLLTSLGAESRPGISDANKDYVLLDDQSVVYTSTGLRLLNSAREYGLPDDRRYLLSK